MHQRGEITRTGSQEWPKTYSRKAAKQTRLIATESNWADLPPSDAIEGLHTEYICALPDRRATMQASTSGCGNTLSSSIRFACILVHSSPSTDSSERTGAHAGKDSRLSRPSPLLTYLSGTLAFVPWRCKGGGNG